MSLAKNYSSSSSPDCCMVCAMCIEGAAADAVRRLDTRTLCINVKLSIARTVYDSIRMI